MSRDRAFLGHMLQALERVSTLAAAISEDDLASDWKKQNALIRELEVLGEAAGRVSLNFVAVHPEIPWKEITGLRHKLIHEFRSRSPNRVAHRHDQRASHPAVCFGRFREPRSVDLRCREPAAT